jgi:magnesium chelatase family protein
MLPAITLAKAIDAPNSQRVGGRTSARTTVVTRRPFRAPHHTISDVGLISGGHEPLSGDVSPAHHGMRFLYARPEFRRHGLEVRVEKQPRESSWLGSFRAVTAL